MTRLRAIVADDHRMLADALKLVLEARCDVVASVRDGRELLEAAAKLKPDIIVLDIGMPHHGFDAGKLGHLLPHESIDMTMHDDPYLVGASFPRRALPLPERAASELTEAVDRVMRQDLRHAQRSRGPDKHRVARSQTAPARPSQRLASAMFQLLAEGVP